LRLKHKRSLTFSIRSGLLFRSGRSGPAEAGNDHPELLTLDGLQTLFNNRAGTAKSDERVGRALLGWKHTDSVGGCPSVLVLPPNEQVTFKYCTAHLMGRAQTLLLEVKMNLMSSLILYWTDFQVRNPSHLLMSKMLIITGVTEDKLGG
jgi:hypothetical protein